MNFGVGRGLTHDADNPKVKAIGGFPFRTRTPSGLRGRWENASAGAAAYPCRAALISLSSKGHPVNSKRRLVLLLGCSALAPVAMAQGRYPAGPIRFIVPFAPGGGSDFIARQIAARLNAAHAYDVAVENRPGAGGNLGAEQALKEPADGHTLLVISGSYAGNAVLNKPEFDPVQAIQPIVQFTREPLVLIVGAASAVRTLGELVDKARKAPASLSYGSPGAGSLLHLATENLSMLAGVTLNHIPYRGTRPALTDVANGRVDLMLGGTTSVLPLVKAGDVRPLAVGTPRRLAALPGVPTFAEAGVAGFRTDLWHGLVAARGVPAAAVARLNADINAVLRSRDVAARLAADGVTPTGGTPEQFGKLIRADMERWERLVQQGAIKLK